MLIHELESNWHAIMNIFNIICPRPAKPTVSSGPSSADGTKEAPPKNPIVVITQYDSYECSPMFNQKLSNKYGWKLMLLARQLVEEIIVILGLEDKISFYNSSSVNMNLYETNIPDKNEDNNANGVSSLQQIRKQLSVKSKPVRLEVEIDHSLEKDGEIFQRRKLFGDKNNISNLPPDVNKQLSLRNRLILANNQPDADKKPLEQELPLPKRSSSPRLNI